MSTNKFTTPNQPQQANQTATKDPILDQIIDRKTANHPTETKPETQPIINVTVDTASIAAEIEKAMTGDILHTSSEYAMTWASLQPY